MKFLKPGRRLNARQLLTRATRSFSSVTLLVLALLIVTPLIVFVVKVSGQSGGSALLISEFRVRGPNGANDEFVEIYNNSDSAHVVTSSDGSLGYAIAASDGVVRCVIPNGTVFPARGHFLCANTIGYSLASYPAGNGTTATPDASFTNNINDNAGVAVFSTSNPANFNLATRFDAVGSTSEANTLYKEGTGYPALIPFSIDYSFYRSYCPVSAAGADPVCSPGDSGIPQDTNDNASTSFSSTRTAQPRALVNVSEPLDLKIFRVPSTTDRAWLTPVSTPRSQTTHRRMLCVTSRRIRQTTRRLERSPCIAHGPTTLAGT